MLQTVQQDIAQNGTKEGQMIQHLDNGVDDSGYTDECQDVPGSLKAPSGVAGTSDIDALSLSPDLEERKSMLSKWERMRLDQALDPAVQVVALDWRYLSGGKITATVMQHAETLVREKHVQAGEIEGCKRWLLDNDKKGYFTQIPMGLGHIVNDIGKWRSSTSEPPKNEDSSLRMTRQERDEFSQELLEWYPYELVLYNEERDGIPYIIVARDDLEEFDLYVYSIADWNNLGEERIQSARAYGRQYWQKHLVPQEELKELVEV
jgi:hypothetical protein